MIRRFFQWLDTIMFADYHNCKLAAEFDDLNRAWVNWFAVVDAEIERMKR